MVESSTAGTSFSPAPVGGRRRRSHKVHHHRKTAKKVSARTIRRTLSKLGMRPKGRLVLKGGTGEKTQEEKAAAAAAAAAAEARQKQALNNSNLLGGRGRSASVSVPNLDNNKGKKPSRRRNSATLRLPKLRLPF